MAPIRLSIVVSLLLAPALGAQRAAIRDSAGVRIVTIPKADVPSRRLLPTPLTVLGEDESSTIFGSVVGAVRLGDGSVVVADGKTQELRLFTASGALVRAIGRRGQGPGDFRRIAKLFRLPGDTILVWDDVLNRLTRFTSSGELARTEPVNPLPNSKGTGALIARPLLTLFGVLTNGTLLGSYSNSRFNPTTNVFRDTLFVVRIAPGGEAEAVVTLAKGESYVYASSLTNMVSSDLLPFTAPSRVAAAGESFWRTDARRFELREYSPHGELKTIVRLSRSPATVTSREMAAFRAGLVTAARTEKLDDPSLRPKLIRQAQLQGAWLVFPASHPAFTDVIVSSTGELWAREHGDSTKAARWQLFTPTGTLEATIQIPLGVEILEVGSDYVLTRVRNDDDVESVRVYRYVK